jgi:hypothetical protein
MRPGLGCNGSHFSRRRELMDGGLMRDLAATDQHLADAVEYSAVTTRQAFFIRKILFSQTHFS